MERSRSEIKVQKAVENWKRLQEVERLKEAEKVIRPKLEKIVVQQKNTHAPPLKEIA